MHAPSGVSHIKTLGNNMVVEDEDGTIRQVSASYKNRLLYEHGISSIFDSDEKIEICDNPYIAITPTESENVYRLKVGNNPKLLTPPEVSESVLKGVYEMVENNNPEGLREAYSKASKHYDVRRRVMQKVSNSLGGEVVTKETGWEIMGLFTLTWDRKVFLNIGKDATDKTSYRPSGNRVRELEDPRGLINLENRGQEYRTRSKLKIGYVLPPDKKAEKDIKRECPICSKERTVFLYKHTGDEVFECGECGQTWKELRLKPEEQEMIDIAKWLMEYRDRLDDSAYWSVIESSAGYSPRDGDRKF